MDYGKKCFYCTFWRPTTAYPGKNGYCDLHKRAMNSDQTCRDHKAKGR